MAIFSGGRYLRAQLQGAGGDFWQASEKANTNGEDDAHPSHSEEHLALKKCAELPLRFWNFDGDVDGEDFKADFKQNIWSIEILLSDEKKAEIVDEAHQIIKYLIDIVEEIETLVGPMSHPTPRQSPTKGLSSFSNLPVYLASACSWNPLSAIFKIVFSLFGPFRRSRTLSAPYVPSRLESRPVPIPVSVQAAM